MRSDVYVKSVLEKVEGLARARLWTQRVRPRAWINNFDVDDRAAAAYLLDHFCFCSDEITQRLFASAFDAMAHGPWLRDPAGSRANRLTAVIAPVEGEDPNRADSGNLMCRLARQVLGVPEARIVDPVAACAAAERGEPVILVDDFVGSGEQILTMLGRRYRGRRLSDALARGAAIYYVAAVATSYGAERVRNSTAVSLFVGHELDESYSLGSPAFLASASEPLLAAEIEPLLAKYAPRLRPKEQHMQDPSSRAYGFHERRLALAFDHSVPDATLPLFWAPGDNPQWTPLVERR